MSKTLYRFVAFITLIVCFHVKADDIDIHDTKLLSQPALTKDHIAFVYAGDLWISNLDGTSIRRLTSDEGVESNPIFSPNGKMITFNAQYDGNTDVSTSGRTTAEEPSQLSGFLISPITL